MKLATKQATVTDHVKTGAFARKLRKSKGISLRSLAKELDKSAVFISDLERGRRNWTPEMSFQYGQTLEKMAAERKATK